jgi:hypothetical protein
MIVVLCACLVLLLVWVTYLHMKVKHLAWRSKHDTPLTEIVTGTIRIQRAYFTEALKIPEEELNGSPDRIRRIVFQLEIWKDHYSGNLSFWSAKKALKSEPIFKTSTRNGIQFPLELAAHSLFGRTDEKLDGTRGADAPEVILVLLAPSALVIRARNGRFSWHPSWGAGFEPEPQDIVIPLLREDLEEFESSFSKDADYDRMTLIGKMRMFKRNGRWTRWNVHAVYPENLAEATRKLDLRPAKPSSGDIDERRCVDCGAQIVIDATFCDQCGAKVTP